MNSLKSALPGSFNLHFQPQFMSVWSYNDFQIQIEKKFQYYATLFLYMNDLFKRNWLHCLEREDHNAKVNM